MNVTAYGFAYRDIKCYWFVYIYTKKNSDIYVWICQVYENILPLGISFLSVCDEIGKILNFSCCAALVVACGQLPNHFAHFLPQCTAPPEGRNASCIFLSEFIGRTTTILQCGIQYNAPVTSGPV